MPTLYHYTTPAGFEGILKSRGIWVTDTRFLNDREEFKTGWDVFHEVFRAHEVRLQNQFPLARESISGAMRGIDITVAHVASFSRNGDVLSQWRGYNDGYGFSLGFDDQAVNSAAQSQHFELCPVAYERAEHFEAMQAKFNLLFRELEGGGRPLNVLMMLWWQSILRLVTVLKNGHFREEAEVRLFAGGAADTDSIKVRATTKTLIPYVQMQLDRTAPLLQPHHSLGIIEVIVGPAMSANQRFAAECLLQQHHIDARVHTSSIPYIGT